MEVLKTKVFVANKIKELEIQANKFLVKNKKIEIKQVITSETQHGRRLMFFMTVLYK